MEWHVDCSRNLWCDFLGALLGMRKLSYICFIFNSSSQRLRVKQLQSWNFVILLSVTKCHMDHGSMLSEPGGLLSKSFEFFYVQIYCIFQDNMYLQNKATHKKYFFNKHFFLLVSVSRLLLNKSPACM